MKQLNTYSNTERSTVEKMAVFTASLQQHSSTPTSAGQLHNNSLTTPGEQLDSTFTAACRSTKRIPNVYHSVTEGYLNAAKYFQQVL
ncbi:MAG: hypothetical protein EOP56_10075 [Sphingobacteriales bacterium]|nr:MAG: hypothetical protein EOP56_10075 [Sphingobacteriales bacterium]